MPFGLGAAARRRRRADRHEAIRVFADEVGWQVQGLLPGTTRRYPAVGLLAGTVDPDLVVAGSLGGRPGELAGLLTRDAAVGAPEGSDRRAADLRGAGTESSAGSSAGSRAGSGAADRPEERRGGDRRAGDRRAGDRRGSDARDPDGSVRAERGPDRRVGDRRAGERVLLLAAAEVGPRIGGLRIRVVGGGGPTELDLTAGSPDLLDALRPWLRPALDRGDLVVGDEVVLGELTLAVVGPWRAELARPGALRQRVELAHQLAAQLDLP